jgi:hypothetical protein
MIGPGLVCMVLAGCGGTSALPEPSPEGCQIRAGAALTEGTVSFTGVGGVSADARGGAATITSDCPDDFHVITRTGSSIVCYGSDDWCTAALDSLPVSVTPAQLREMAQGQ